MRVNYGITFIYQRILHYNNERYSTKNVKNKLKNNYLLRANEKLFLGTFNMRIIIESRKN